MPEPEVEDIRQFLGAIPHFQIREIDIGKLKKPVAKENTVPPQINTTYGIDYENPTTGVYFQMFYSTPDAADESPSFPSMELSGLGVHVNLVRPTYFALESFPLITQIAERFGLLVLDNQNSSTHREPFKPDSHTLVDSWIRTNSWAVGQFRKEGRKIPYLARERLDYNWSFLKRSVGMQQKLGDYVFVPTRILLGEKEGLLGSFVTWPDYIPMVFPQVDWVVIGHSEYSPGGYSILGFARLIDILQILAEDLKTIADPVAHYLLSQELSKDTQRKFEKLHLIDKKEIKGISPETVVDVPP